jgi:hypothetical protein
MKYVSSDGGPLIAIPIEWAKTWCGTEPSPGTNAPDGWQWSGNEDDPVRTDYDRACGKLRAVHLGSYGNIGLLGVGKGDAVVLTLPTDTTFVELPDGGAFLRNVTFASSASARAAVAAAPKWKKTRAEIRLKDGRMVLFNAAYPYPGAVRSAMGRPEILTAKLKPGLYRIFASDYEPPGAGDYELRVCRLVRQGRLPREPR